MPSDRNEGLNPAARQAAEAWQRRFGREGHEGSYARHHDEAYQRLRQRHLEELDRDYDEWCRTREEQFQRDFDEFRSSRRQGAGTGLPVGAPMTNDPGDSSTLAEDRTADRLVAAAEADPAGPRGSR